MTELEKFQLVLTAIVFVVVFVCVFAYRFVTNCVIEWPIRWDMRVCWHEQVQPAKDAATKKASSFVP